MSLAVSKTIPKKSLKFKIEIILLNCTTKLTTGFGSLVALLQVIVASCCLLLSFAVSLKQVKRCCFLGKGNTYKALVFFILFFFKQYCSLR